MALRCTVFVRTNKTNNETEQSWKRKIEESRDMGMIRLDVSF